MSKWNRPMRAYKPATVRCGKCAEPIRCTDYGWIHTRPIRITDPNWHPAVPA